MRLHVNKGKGIVIQELDFEINSHHFLCRLFLSSALFLSKEREEITKKMNA